MNSLIRIIQKDSRVRKLKRSFDTLPYFNIPSDALLEEISNLHEIRKVRHLKLKENLDGLVQANIQDQSFRSRLVEISMLTLRSKRRLESALNSLGDYLLVEYSENLRLIKTKEERTRALKVAFSIFYKHIDRMSEVKEQADLVIQDIDKAAYSLKLTVETMKISSQREVYV